MTGQKDITPELSNTLLLLHVVYIHYKIPYTDLPLTWPLIFFKSSPNLFTALRNISISSSPHLPLLLKTKIKKNVNVEIKTGDEKKSWLTF